MAMSGDQYEGLTKKELYFDEFSKTLKHDTHQYLSFFKDISADEELDKLFGELTNGYGTRHVPLYRMCDGEYAYCVGRKVPYSLSLLRKMRYSAKTMLINAGLMKQKVGHVNKVSGEAFVSESYSKNQKSTLKGKYLEGLKTIAEEGYLSLHLVYSPKRFAEEYIGPILNFFRKSSVKFDRQNYFPFYFVYAMLSLERFKRKLFEGKHVLIVTNFNERNSIVNFEANFSKEKVGKLSFYNISSNRAMLDVIDTAKLPENVDLVLVAAGVGSINIINQLKSLNAVCIDAGHALDCFSRPQLRNDRICLLPDVDVKS